jgi:hypothetical protein
MSKKIPVLITTDKDKRGVFMGYIDKDRATETVLEASEVRMCVYWTADVKGVLGLAATGPTKTCRITKATPLARIHGVTAVMDITKEAEKAWLKEPWG